MLQAGYSRRLNPRRLEFMFYAPWNHLLNSLVYDIKHILVIPQHTIYRSRDPKAAASCDISEVTKPANNADTRIPDFGLLSVDWHDTPPGASHAISPAWSRISIQSPFVPLLCEVKRPPSRGFSNPNQFTFELVNQINLARTELCRATAILFANTQLKHQSNSIVLIAAAGEWYSWTELRRDQLPRPKSKVLKRNWFINQWPARDADLRGRLQANKDSESSDEEGNDSNASGRNRHNDDDLSIDHVQGEEEVEGDQDGEEVELGEEDQVDAEGQGRGEDDEDQDPDDGHHSDVSERSSSPVEHHERVVSDSEDSDDETPESKLITDHHFNILENPKLRKSRKGISKLGKILYLLRYP